MATRVGLGPAPGAVWGERGDRPMPGVMSRRGSSSPWDGAWRASPRRAVWDSDMVPFGLNTFQSPRRDHARNRPHLLDR